MIRRKKNVKRILLTSIFLFSILLANSQIFEVFNFNDLHNFQADLTSDNERLSSSNSYLEDYYITGSGIQQDVRIYAENSSSSLNNEGKFEIPSMSTTDTSYLSYGYFNFTFQNNYTTDYVIENTDALYANDFIKFIYNEDISAITIHTGSNLDTLDLNRLVDTNPATYIRFTNGTKGTLNFTISSSFLGTSYSRTNPTFSLNFNRNYILGLIANYQFSISRNVYLTLRVFDISDSTWKNLTEPIFFNSSISTHNIEKRFINENLRYINSTSVSKIQFFFYGFDTSSYILTLREYKLTSTYAFDLPITNTNYITL